MTNASIHDYSNPDQREPFRVFGLGADLGDLAPYFTVYLNGSYLYVTPERLAELHAVIGAALASMPAKETEVTL